MCPVQGAPIAKMYVGPGDNSLRQPSQRRGVSALNPTRGSSASTSVPEPRFNGPIDAVYTWVDDSDPAWRTRRARARASEESELHPTAVSASRFENHDELRYSLRSLQAYAPWIRHIYLVTDSQIPAWLRDEHPGLTVVDHRDILPAEALPTFNSHCIETALHHIDGLAEHFLYFNDDVFLGEPVTPDHFFTPDGGIRVFQSPKRIEGELPVMRAARRNAQIVQELTGHTVTQRYRHTPHPQRVSVSRELEAAVPDQVEMTQSHHFRHPEDISFAASLTLSYAVATHRGVNSDTGYAYVDLSGRRAFYRLSKFALKGRRQVVCLNQVSGISPPTKWLLNKILKRFWPWPSKFEQGANFIKGSKGRRG